MIRARIVVSAAVVATAVMAGTAAAQRISSPYEFVERKQDLGPFAAYVLTAAGAAGLNANSGFMAGLQYSLTLSGPMQLNAFGAYWPTERDVIDPAAEGGPASIGTADLPIVLLGLRIKLSLTGARTWHNLVPQIVAGIGLAFDTSQEPNCVLDRETPQCRLAPDERFRFGNAFMGQIGFGVAWMWSQRLGARLSVEDYLWRLTTPDGFRDPDLMLNPAPPQKDWTNNIGLSLGISYWF